MKKSADLIILSKELITCQSSSPKSGKEMRDIGLIKNGALAVKEGKIFALGGKEEIISNFKVDSKDRIIWAAENVVLPGLIDCHAHPVFIETRINEFKLRQKEAGCEEIQKNGGGILSSVDKVRKAAFKELYLKSKQNFLLMFSHGTTTVESKSGYGLDLENEIKILKINQKLNKDLPLNIISTFLGAHAFPIEYQNNHSGYLDLLINKILLKVKKENLAEFIDVFCDIGAFSKKESAQILKAAWDLGFKLKMHAEEFNYLGAVKLAKFFNFTSLDHLMQIKDEDFSLLKKKNIIAVLLPGTTFFLDLGKYAPAKRMIEAGIPIALATDFNPGSCPCFSLEMIISLACLKMKLSIEEAINAVTINAAFALGKEKSIGSLEIGKAADLIILDLADYQSWPYYFGCNLVKMIIKGGKIWKI